MNRLLSQEFLACANTPGLKRHTIGNQDDLQLCVSVIRKRVIADRMVVGHDDFGELPQG
jgi:hypothetical protein